MKSLYRWLFHDNRMLDRRHRIKDAIERSRYGVAKSDTWSFDAYLARVIVNGLTELRASKAGYPSCIDFELDNATDVYSDDCLSFYAAILTAIIDGFQRCVDDSDTGPDELTLSLFNEYYGSFWI